MHVLWRGQVSAACPPGRWSSRSGAAAQIPQNAQRIKTPSTSEKLMKRRAVQKHGLFSFLLLVLAPCVAAPQDAPQPNQVGPYVIRTNVDLVVLRATVRDRKGAPVSGLNKENFQVYEDKVLQQIEPFSHDN